MVGWRFKKRPVSWRNWTSDPWINCPLLYHWAKETMLVGWIEHPTCRLQNDCSTTELNKQRATWAGFEPARAKPRWFQIIPLRPLGHHVKKIGPRSGIEPELLAPQANVLTITLYEQKFPSHRIWTDDQWNYNPLLYHWARDGLKKSAIRHNSPDGIWTRNLKFTLI